mmetsp:Transcript_10431/g.21425  ORF Transcript_10431/g.21425 Transcript_10431/m.21425 type:complete len:252 (+) Transcript_10431:1464-2219(+)
MPLGHAAKPGPALVQRDVVLERAAHLHVVRAHRARYHDRVRQGALRRARARGPALLLHQAAAEDVALRVADGDEGAGLPEPVQARAVLDVGARHEPAAAERERGQVREPRPADPHEVHPSLALRRAPRLLPAHEAEEARPVRPLLLLHHVEGRRIVDPVKGPPALAFAAPAVPPRPFRAAGPALREAPSPSAGATTPRDRAAPRLGPRGHGHRHPSLTGEGRRGLPSRHRRANKRPPPHRHKHPGLPLSPR